MNPFESLLGRPNDGIATLPSYPGAAPAKADPGQAAPAQAKGEVVRISAADVLPPASLGTPTPQSIDKLEIPAPLRQAAEKALTAGEKMLWIGRTSRNRAVHPPCAIPPAGGFGLIGLGGLIVVATLAAAAISLHMTFNHVFGCIFGGIMALIGTAIVYLPKINKPEKLCRYCYVVTNRRAILVEQTLMGTNTQSYLPQQLLGLERRDHAEVAGAGDIVFEYVTVMGNTFDPNTGGFLQAGPTGPSTDPQRVPRGFVCLDQVREVEDLIRTKLLLQLEQALDGKAFCEIDCPCGTTLQAPPIVGGKSIQCPRCSAVVAIQPSIDNGPPIICREDGNVPAELKEKMLAGLDPSEKPVWIGQPVPKLVFLRNGLYLAISVVGVTAALIWLAFALAPASSAPPQPQRQQAGKKAVAPPPAPAAQSSGMAIMPIVLLLVSAGFAAVPTLRWWTARNTAYALTTRRVIVYTKGLFGVTRDSYSPLEVTNMKRANSWVLAGCGDLIFRTVHVITRSRSRSGASSDSVRTIHYGILAVANLDEVEKVVRETLIDPFVDKLGQASVAAQV
jgi:hypothetical protein